MTQFFRSGYFEYDKRKVVKTHPCKTCGGAISGGKQYCLPCYATRYEENIAANRHKYRGKKYGRAKVPT